jgi:SAM-dependent methyltransferase
MNWRNKARLAKAIDKLPSRISYSTYYFIQRHLGSLRAANPIRCLKAGVAIVDLIKKHKHELTGAETFLEVGTGRSLSLPVALWLCGAFRTITVDLNPYLKPEMVFEEIEYIRTHQEMVRQLFGLTSQKPAFRERFDLLLDSRRDLGGLLSLMNVRYIAPADAGRLDLATGSIDYHVSHAVVEHVSREALDRIFLEGKRILKATGLAIHYASLGDLFSSVDHSISPVNFLQFSEKEWESIAGNRYMYHNRLRVDELRDLFEHIGFRILCLEATIDPETLRVLKNGKLPLAPRFRDKSPETNASQRAWITAAPA